MAISFNTITPALVRSCSQLISCILNIRCSSFLCSVSILISGNVFCGKDFVRV
jgi:hypothetical protein